MRQTARSSHELKKANLDHQSQEQIRAGSSIKAGSLKFKWVEAKNEIGWSSK